MHPGLPMRHLRVLLVLLAPVLFGLAGCASPPTDLYTLAAIPGAPVHTPARSIELRRIGLAAYLDRPEIVRSNAQYRLRVAASDRWGEPLGTMLGRVLTEDLVQRLPDASIFLEFGAISTQPDLVLEIDIQRFDPDGDDSVVLLAQIALRRERSKASDAMARTIRLTAAPATSSTQDLAAALSFTLAQLADRVAASVAAIR